MDQDSYGDSSDAVKWTEYVDRRCGTEAEDGFSLVQYYKGL